MKRFITLLTTLLISINVWSQLNAVYPVDLAATITPPYGTCLKDYVGSKRFQVHALLRDMTKKSDQFVIELSVKNSGGKVIFRSSFGNYDLAPGKPYVMPMEASKSITSDLFDVKNITIGSRYATECFPEGSYTFSFQAFSKNNYPQRRIALSRESVVIMFLQATVKNPYLVMPYDKDSIPCETSQIMYQWQSANPTGERIAYHLQVAEMNGTGSANSAIASGNKVVDKILYNTMYLDQETSGKYQKNTKYAWTVTVNDAPVKENTVRTFVYCGTPQQAPEPYKVKKDERKFGMSLDRIDMDTVEIKDNAPIAEWFKGSPAILDKYCAIGVEIRKYGQEKWTPYVVSVSDTSMSISDISYDTKYQVRAQYIQCNAKEDGTIDSLYAPYSDTLLFSLPNPVDTTDCSGDLPELADCSGSERIILKVGDEINANGTMIGIDSISYNAEDSTIVSGLGHLAFPIIKRIGVKMQFKDIKVNCKGQLAMGAITSVYDPSTSFMIDIEELTGEQSGGGKDNATSEAKTTPYSKEAFDKGNKGDYFVKSDSSVVMKDSDGNEINIGQLVAMDGKTFQNRNHIADATHCVKFSNSDKKNIAFDDNEQGYYKTIMPNDYHPYDQNNQYVIPWMANNPGKVKLIDASELNSKSTTESFDSVMFVIPASNNTYINLLADNAGGQYKVHIPGTSDVKHSTEIHAIGRMKGQSTFINAGKMMVANYAERTHKLNIVSLVGELPFDYKKIVEDSLRSIYGKLGVSFNVNYSIFNNDEVNEILKDGLKIGADYESSWKSETEEMKIIRKIYNKTNSFDKTSAYLFVVNHAQEEEYAKVLGDMPRSKPVGYIFRDMINENNLGHLVSHEIGHGLYKLQHVFEYDRIEKGSTDNLMDYDNNGCYLAHFQWRIMQDSVMLVWSFAQEDEDGFIIKDDDDLLYELFQKLRCAYASNAAYISVTHPINSTSLYMSKSDLKIYDLYFMKRKIGRYAKYRINKIDIDKAIKKYNDYYDMISFSDELEVRFRNSCTESIRKFFKTTDFNDEIQQIKNKINSNKPIVPLLLDASFCTLRDLDAKCLIYALKELHGIKTSWTTIFTEKYENLTLNILRAANLLDKQSAEKVYKYIVNTKGVYFDFLSGMSSINGLDNESEFVVVLAELYKKVVVDGCDKHMLEYGDPRHIVGLRLTCVYVDESPIFHIPYEVSSTVFDWHYHSCEITRKDGGFIIPNSTTHNLNYYYGKNGNWFSLDESIYVVLNVDNPIAPKGSMVRIPAFELCYFLSKDLTNFRVDFYSRLFSALTIIWSGPEMLGMKCLSGYVKIGRAVKLGAYTIAIGKTIKMTGAFALAAYDLSDNLSTIFSGNGILSNLKDKAKSSYGEASMLYYGLSAMEVVMEFRSLHGVISDANSIHKTLTMSVDEFNQWLKINKITPYDINNLMKCFTVINDSWYVISKFMEANGISEDQIERIRLSLQDINTYGLSY